MTNARDMIELCEMANAIQRYTGLPGVIYFSTSAEVTGHNLGRVKWLDSGKEAYTTIKVNTNGERKSGGDARMVAKLEKFVILNEDILWKYWNTEPDKADSAATMKSFTKV